MVDPPTYAGDLELYDAWILQVELYLTNIGLDWQSQDSGEQLKCTRFI